MLYDKWYLVNNECPFPTSTICTFSLFLLAVSGYNTLYSSPTLFWTRIWFNSIESFSQENINQLLLTGFVSITTTVLWLALQSTLIPSPKLPNPNRACTITRFGKTEVFSLLYQPLDWPFAANLIFKSWMFWNIENMGLSKMNKSLVDFQSWLLINGDIQICLLTWPCCFSVSLHFCKSNKCFFIMCDLPIGNTIPFHLICRKWNEELFFVVLCSTS